MPNLTMNRIEEGYPSRFELPEDKTSWDLEVPEYEPGIYPEFSVAQERLEQKGLIVDTPVELNGLAGLNNRQALETYGDAVIKLRNPLGRTGINGLGIFYEAGESATADIAIMRRIAPRALMEIALVYNRGDWKLPGGFAEPDELDDLRKTAIREGFEEIGIDVYGLDAQGMVKTLSPRDIKASSRRVTDMGFLSNQVETVMLPDYDMGHAIEARDDAEAAAWFSRDKVIDSYNNGEVSSGHYRQIIDAFEFH